MKLQVIVVLSIAALVRANKSPYAMEGQELGQSRHLSGGCCSDDPVCGANSNGAWCSTSTDLCGQCNGIWLETCGVPAERTGCCSWDGGGTCGESCWCDASPQRCVHGCSGTWVTVDDGSSSSKDGSTTTSMTTTSTTTTTATTTAHPVSTTCYTCQYSNPCNMGGNFYNHCDHHKLIFCESSTECVEVPCDPNSALHWNGNVCGYR